jgi:hypothetical protein
MKQKRKPGEPKGEPTPKQIKRDMQHPNVKDRHLRGAEAGRRSSPGPRST